MRSSFDGLEGLKRRVESYIGRLEMLKYCEFDSKSWIIINEEIEMVENKIVWIVS